jgi:hypothetical protein
LHPGETKWLLIDSLRRALALDGAANALGVALLLARTRPVGSLCPPACALGARSFGAGGLCRRARLRRNDRRQLVACHRAPIKKGAPGASPSETTAPDQYPGASYSGNYDTAYDVYTTDTGLTDTDNVFTLRNGFGQIVDAVLVSDDPTGTAATPSEIQAAVVAAAGQWTDPSGQVPEGGFIDDAFSASAALDLNASGATAAGTTLQRIDDMDRNHSGDWDNTGLVPQTWGANNPGQTSF